MDWPHKSVVVPSHINLWQPEYAPVRVVGVGTPSGQSWIASNTAVYIPILLPWPYRVMRAFCVAGNSSSGNVDIGIYAPGGTRLWSAGSTVQSGSNAPQYFTVSPDLLLDPGRYFLAFNASDATNGRVQAGSPSATAGRIAGLYQQASAFPLPATATFAQYGGGGGYPVIGITNTASGF